MQEQDKLQHGRSDNIVHLLPSLTSYHNAVLSGL